jgi:outer membrane protein assembly factor BamA
VTTEPASGGVRVIITVEENPVVSGYNIMGAGPIHPHELVSLLESKPGRVFNLNHLRTEVQRVQDYYAKRGYIASVTAEVGIEKNGILNLPIEVAKLGPVRLDPKGLLSEAELRKVMRTKPGDYYNSKALDEDCRSIEALLRAKGHKVEVVRVRHKPDPHELPRLSTESIEIRLLNKEAVNKSSAKSKKPVKENEPSEKGSP